MQLKLTPVNGSNRLWAISDIWHQELVNQVMAIDWLDEPAVKSPGDMACRAVLNPQHQCIKSLDEIMLKHLPEINRITHSNFATCYSMWTMCETGYISPIHHDGELPNNMLIFWHAPDRSYGTTFYNSDSSNDIAHQFESVAGTGYLMLNHADDTGNRPVQYHGMIKRIPANCWRLISAWQFSTIKVC
jgi:hypothetical protein